MTWGMNAVRLHEEGLNRLLDPAILKKARCEERVLLTHDLGFGTALRSAL